MMPAPWHRPTRQTPLETAIMSIPIELRNFSAQELYDRRAALEEELELVSVLWRKREKQELSKKLLDEALARFSVTEGVAHAG
jgi:hypothetical protein